MTFKLYFLKMLSITIDESLERKIMLIIHAYIGTQSISYIYIMRLKQVLFQSIGFLKKHL